MTASIISDNPDDKQRKFVITYFLHDDTLLVYEPPIRNSGIVGGKFLEKAKYEHEANEEPGHQQRDLEHQLHPCQPCVRTGRLGPPLADRAAEASLQATPPDFHPSNQRQTAREVLRSEAGAPVPGEIHGAHGAAAPPAARLQAGQARAPQVGGLLICNRTLYFIY